MIGAAITAYDGNPEDITDPEIGELKFVRKEFGPNIPFTMVEIPSKPCREFEDLESVFSPLGPSSVQQFETY